MKKFVTSSFIFVLSLFFIKGFSVEKADQIQTITPLSNESINIFVIGDFGRRGEHNQREVGEQMGRVGESVNIDFVLTVGDNFYPSGVSGIGDSHWRESFKDVYSAASLNVPWYASLGNHDVRSSNAKHQIAYTEYSGRWYMPYKYYSVEKVIDDTTSLLLVALDTNPFIEKYHRRRLFNRYYRYVTEQDTTEQLRWLDSTLTHSAAEWKIVYGHHPVYSAGRKHGGKLEMQRMLKPILERHNVDLYIAGHDHNLQHLKPPGDMHYFISGAGSKTRRVGRHEHLLFGERTSGFMYVSLTAERMRVKFIDYKGNVIYTTLIDDDQY